MVLRILAAATAALWSTTASAAWHEASSKHFVVYSEGDPAQLKAYTEQLEKYDRAMKVMRGVAEDQRGPWARVTIFTVRDLAAVQKLVGGASVGGFYIPRASGSYAFVPRTAGGTGRPWEMSSERVLLHEYAHHFMFSDWPDAIFPKWYIEGFAEYHSTALFQPDGSVVFGAPPTDRLFGVADSMTLPLSKMLGPATKLSGAQTYGLYSRGWALTHYLTQDAERRRLLATYVQAINEGKSLEQASAVFGNLNALDAKLVSYVKQPRFASQQVPADRLTIGAVTVRQLSPGEEATMPVRIRSAVGVNERLAAQAVAQARTAAAPYANDAAAQNVLAEAEYDAKNDTATIAAADRALAADPKSVHAMVYRGMALQRIATTAKSKDAAQWKEVRRWFVGANRAETENPWPLILYYKSYGAAGEAAPKNAQDGLLYAAALAPYDLGLKLDAAQVILPAATRQRRARRCCRWRTARTAACAAPKRRKW